MHYRCKYTTAHFIPGKIARRANISAKMHPTDHVSTSTVYCRRKSINSGARYHLVITYSVISSSLLVQLASSWWLITRAIPSNTHYTHSMNSHLITKYKHLLDHEEQFTRADQWTLNYQSTELLRADLHMWSPAVQPSRLTELRFNVPLKTK